jgi:hypothetical protein
VFRVAVRVHLVEHRADDVEVAVEVGAGVHDEEANAIGDSPTDGGR